MTTATIEIVRTYRAGSTLGAVYAFAGRVCSSLFGGTLAGLKARICATLLKETTMTERKTIQPWGSRLLGLPAKPQTIKPGEMPALNGTPKQIAWADDLRRKILGRVSMLCGEALRRLDLDVERAGELTPEKQAHVDAYRDQLENMGDRLACVVSARAWIDARHLLRHPDGDTLKSLWHALEDVSSDFQHALNAE